MIGRFVLERLVYFAIGLVFLVTVCFFITRILPGDPTHFLVGPFADEETLAAARERFGLDDPITTQYVTYVEGLARGDLGTSIRTQQPVLNELGTRWPATLELGLTAGFLAMLWAIPLGALSALRRGSRLDRATRFVAAIGVSTPEFWLGMILILVFFSWLGIAPAPLGRSSGAVPETITGLYVVDSVLTANWAALADSVKQLILPAVTLALIAGAPMMRVTRTFMLEVLDSDYIRAAESLGMSKRRILWRHALPNVAIPASAMFVIILGWVLGGTALVEYVFAWPGIGKYAVDSISAADYEPVMGVLLISAVTYLILYLATDIFHLFLDPRTRA